MSIYSRLSINGGNLMDAAVGSQGVSESEIAGLDTRLAGIRRHLSAWRQGEEPSFLGLPFQTDLEHIKKLGNELSQSFQQFVVFGIGGSALGGIMLADTLGKPHDQDRVIFYDNVDPSALQELSELDWEETCVLAVSKSGNTAETLAQLLTVLPYMERQLGPEGVAERLVVITEDKQGALYQIGQRLNARLIEHPPVGGRFIVLSVVGLLPAYLAGVDIDLLMEGARAMGERCAKPDLNENPALWHGAAQYILSEKGKNISLWLAYSEHLHWVVDWYRQLCAESLGKHDKHGREWGLTPVYAKGVTDQHSQLQLYLDGPGDKQFSFITYQNLRQKGEMISSRFADLAAVTPLAGHSVGELFHAEFLATRETLTRRQRPNRTISLMEGDAFAIGELIILLETEIAVIAALMDVDAFDQPAVEESKVLTRQYLDEMQSMPDL